MDNRILEGIIHKVGIPRLVSILGEDLSASELTSLMLAVSELRAENLKPSDVLRAYGENRLVAPSSVNPQTFLELDRLAFSLLPDEFQPLELAPVSPLGTASALATCSQNKVVSAIRGTEVISDATNYLALEAAGRRRELVAAGKPGEVVHLCASHRLLRAQHFENPAHSSHFRLFGLVSSGPDQGGFAFETEHLCTHISFFLSLMECTRSLGLLLQDPKIRLTCYEHGIPRAILMSRVVGIIEDDYPRAEIELQEDADNAYYQGCRFGIDVRNREGAVLNLVDGGFTDWTQKLLSSDKERLLISGFGSELACSCFT